MKERKKDLVLMQRKTFAPITVLLITLLLIASVSSLKAASEAPQMQWEKTYGPVEGHSMVQTIDGGYAIAGANATWYKHPLSVMGDWVNFTFLLVKTDATGELQWRKEYSNEGKESIAKSVVQTKDGGYALSGVSFEDFGINESFWLVKTDANGNIEWNRTYLGEVSDASCVAIQTEDEGYAIAGYMHGDVSTEAWLVKVDKDGNLQWNKTYGPAYSWFSSIVETDDGGFALAGATLGDFWLVKTDSNGNVQFDKNYGGRGAEEARSLVTTIDGYLMVGKTNSFGAGDDDGWVVKTDLEGNMQWNTTFGGAGRDVLHSVSASNEGYVVAGVVDSLANRAAVVAKLNMSGEIDWETLYDSDGTPTSIIKSKDGGYVFAGYKEGGSVNSQVWLVKIAPEPDVTPPKISVLSPENNATFASDVPLTFTVNEPVSWIGYSLDGQDNVTVTGNTTLTGLDTGWHNLTVFAEDAFGNIGASETIYFNVTEPFPTPLIVAAIAISAVIVAVAVIYYRRRSPST